MNTSFLSDFLARKILGGIGVENNLDWRYVWYGLDQVIRFGARADQLEFEALLIENMNLFRAEAQRLKGTKKKKGNFGISYFDSATPNLIWVLGRMAKVCSRLRFICHNHL
ncbi:hypothetical protein [Cylindrospermum sp. FACHB-282]|uniref:hypothetical protein n=1 Tax=Cylindrospermum sp. FACHB-282 TaxID=2692794 RepID=UPI00168313A6|nr:hypothetical protein [Cylindrospermum sp. FACHB-282]MBD2385500.1 hypothetical protein [Cylindrospermum sp. FACHB-282]